jgi:hypothetical protein
MYKTMNTNGIEIRENGVHRFFLRLLPVVIFLSLAFSAQGQPGSQWSTAKAWKWYNSNPWICGFNYIPANAINYTAMWDKTSFSPDEIDKELALAEATGFNTVRVVLQFAVWEDDPAYFTSTFSKFLAICTKHKMRVMPALLDECVFGTNVDPSIGKQPEPLNGWYAWAWSPSPGETMVKDTTSYPRIGKYVKDLIGTFRDNPAILAWDLYNEPSTSALSDKSYLLVRKVFDWARQINPTQPLTVAYWGEDPELNKIIFANSDVITFHSYSAKPAVEKLIAKLKQENRPVICTEWLNRPTGSTVESILPVFARENVGCLHWGLVNGKTQTHLPWGHRPADLPYNRIWQHDLYTGDYKVYSPYEMKLFKSFIGESISHLTVIADSTLYKAQNELITKFGEQNRDRIVRGTAQLSKNWRKADGNQEEFMKFCNENFLAGAELASNFKKIEQNLSMQNGFLYKIRYQFTESGTFTDGKELKVDGFFRKSIPSVDLWQEKLAQFINLNFPSYTLVDKRLHAKSWDREKWAMVQLGNAYSERQNPDFKAEAIEEVRDFNKYIGKYFFRMHHITSKDGSYPFTTPLTLHSHFGLRDNLKEDYTRPGGLARQEIAGKLIEHITGGTVPVEFIQDTSTRWNPWTNQLYRIVGGKQVAIESTKEGTTRYAGLLAKFRNRSSEDKRYGAGSTVIQRTFENSNLTVEEVENLIRTFLSDPVIATTGKLISKRLGRPLQPFDIWYSGFQSQSAYPANMLDSITRARYPNPAALQKDLPAILRRMGFAEAEADYIGTHAIVRPVGAGGYSEQPPMRGDTALMTTVFNPEGLDYKGYRISMHELGHVVCGVYSTSEVDHMLLADVPTGGITEGFAEMLAYKNIEGLGLKSGTVEQQKDFLALASMWYMLDLGGQALTDIETWKWMYAHPDATPAQLQAAVMEISAGIWNQYYAGVFGGIRDQHILAIYNHFITGSLYLYNYFLGNIIMFQLYDKFMPDNLAAGLKKACSEGNTLPELWMQKAVNQGISLDPLLKVARVAVGKLIR